MTNAMIILWESVSLLELGIIKGTGRIFKFEDESGNIHELEEPEELHTYAAWQEIGRQVKKGEKAKAAITIWKQGKSYTTTNKETGAEEEKEGRMFMKMRISLHSTRPSRKQKRRERGNSEEN